MYMYENALRSAILIIVEKVGASYSSPDPVIVFLNSTFALHPETHYFSRALD